jgi:hypothetical protein
VTPGEERNSEATDGWLASWNDDVDRMVDEYYAPDCEVILVQSGEVLRGREELRQFEHGLMQTFPARGSSLARKIVSGDTVVVELERRGYGTDGESIRRSCIVLTFNEHAQVLSDHSYANVAPSAVAAGIDPDHFGAEMIARGAQAARKS